MADLIQLLPDHIANQIAAGEVIQRPASAVKELLENSVDAGSGVIQLIVKDAGRTLIQVIDDGCGMSETDARMAFARHATSKIRKAEDLFAIRTMGFRGEAMASMAAVAQVELKTRKHAEEMGVRLIIEGSEVKKQEPCQTAPGTSIAVKNLFFNVPARRNFLKSDKVEWRHIVDEFNRVAIANPDIHFSLHHNGAEQAHLPAGKLRQRLVNLFGRHINTKILPVSEETDVLRIRGFVGKPEHAKKTRGEQFFFVNNRFIKSGYLHHALMGAYEALLPEGAYPLYAIFLDIDPAHLDVNVHPTKQEVNFEDERLVYHYLRVAVRHALGRHGAMPTLDFDQDPGLMAIPPIKPDQNKGRPPSSGNPTAPNFDQQRQKNNLKHWEKLYESLGAEPVNPTPDIPRTLTIESQWEEEEDQSLRTDAEQTYKAPYQVHNSYIVSHIKSGFLLIDQQAAHERILYEELLQALEENETRPQQQLFPVTLEFGASDAALMEEILEDINLLGFDLQPFGRNTFIVNGLPPYLKGGSSESDLIENLLEQYKNGQALQLEPRENLARSLAKSGARKRGEALTVKEMQTLIDKLFACTLPQKSPTGRNCFMTFELNALEKQFQA